jgi:hypothetical protein
MQRVFLPERKNKSSFQDEDTMSDWGGKRPGAGRKRKPRGPEGEKSAFRIDFSERISLEADGPEGLTRRVVLALACRRASLSEIAAALGLSKDEVVNQF